MPATTCSPIRGRTRTFTRRAAAAASSCSRCTICTYPDARAGTGIADGGTGGSSLAVLFSTLVGRARMTGRVLRSTTRMMWSTWIECARWSAKYTSSARLTNSSATATVTANRGNSSLRSPPDTPTSNSPPVL